MVAAVDVGILNLTNYKAPDPEDWFFGQRQLGLELRDLYGRLIDGSLGATGKLRTGGDGAQMAGATAARRPRSWSPSSPARSSSTPTARRRSTSTSRSSTAPCASWRSPGPRMRSAMPQSDVIVRDPVVVTASLPRFLAPGDKAQLRLDIANTDGPAGDYTLALDSTGDLDRRRLPGQADARPGQAPDADRADQRGRDRRRRHHHPPRFGRRHCRSSSRCRSRCVPPSCRSPRASWSTSSGNGGSLKIDRQLLAASLLDGASSASASRSRPPSTCRRW